eukprot:TRINITY_DN9646_c0_g1_i1.p1 TRINITY_DN9646_c0_g1~~TRINITY_DN9646_c0_g1_i1.p1  ORF type:complete len:440 (-),score=196.98 TRINITY_DN9646_c0_g1_i1:30-1349(-)
MRRHLVSDDHHSQSIKSHKSSISRSIVQTIESSSMVMMTSSRRRWLLLLASFALLAHCVAGAGAGDDGVDGEVEGEDMSDYYSARETHRVIWRLAGFFACSAALMSLYQMRLHVKWNSHYHLRKYVLRILLVVPVYGIESWLGLRFTSTAIYFDTFRECYESFALYSFYCFLVEFLGGERQLVRTLRKKEEQRHFFPFCCCAPWPMGGPFLYNCKLSILQFVILKPAMAIVKFILDYVDLYWVGPFSWASGFPYIMLIDNVSQTVALYGLIIFYHKLRDDLAPVNPVPKFLVVKSVIFFTFWQSVGLSILVQLNIIRPTGGYTTENIVIVIQDFLVCVEMFAAAIAHHWAFSYREFHDPEQQPNAPPMVHSLMQAVDVSDVFVDDVHHALNPEESNLAEGAENSPLLAAHKGYHKPNVFAKNRAGMVHDARQMTPIILD